MQIGAMREQYSRFWQQLLEEAKTSGALKPNLEPRLLRPLLLGTLNRTVDWFDPRKGPVEPLIESVIAMFGGIWAEPSKPPRRAPSSINAVR